MASVPPSSRIYTWLVLTVFALTISLLMFGSYAGGTAVRGVVDYEGGTARVHAPAAAEIRRLHVRVGQPVDAGAPIATLSLAQGPRGLAAQIGELDKQVVELERQLRLAEAGGATDRLGLQQQRSGLEQAIGSLQRQHAIARSQVALAEQTLARSNRLMRENAGSKRQEEEARANLLAQRATAEALNERVITTRAALVDTDAKLRRIAIDADRSISELLARHAALKSEADQLRRSDSLVITAPSRGIVADLPMRPGQRVRPDSSIATLIPDGSPLEVHLFAPSQAIGFARSGQPVRLRFDAFPYQKYGAARGRVIAVSPVAVDPSSIDPTLNVRESVFRIRVRIEPLRNLPALKPGMTVSADMLLERRPLWALLFGPLREVVRR